MRLSREAGQAYGPLVQKFLLEDHNRFGEKRPVRDVATTMFSLLARACGGPQKLRELLKAGDVDGLVRALQMPRRSAAARTLATLSGRTWLLD